jgi:hypothetical protein
MIPPVCLLAADGAMICYALATRVKWPVQKAAAAAVLLFLAYEPYYTYFDLWAPRPEVADAFQAAMADIAYKLNEAPATLPKWIGYAVANPQMANGIPIDMQSIAFLTRSYTEKQRRETNFRYMALPEIQEAVGSRSTGIELCDQTTKIRWPGKMVCSGMEQTPGKSRK